MNTEQLRAELAASEARDAAQAAAGARRTKLQDYRELASATDEVLCRMLVPTNAPSARLAKFRFELKALAAEFGYRIVLVGDRTQAVLVQQ